MNAHLLNIYKEENLSSYFFCSGFVKVNQLIFWHVLNCFRESGWKISAWKIKGCNFWKSYYLNYLTDVVCSILCGKTYFGNFSFTIFFYSFSPILCTYCFFAMQMKRLCLLLFIPAMWSQYHGESAIGATGGEQVRAGWLWPASPGLKTYREAGRHIMYFSWFP